jgi:predicted glycoside hydrolase/deacetylase ChbG (UPF0249 family)
MMTGRRLLIINADDFGQKPGRRSASLMVRQNVAREAVELAVPVQL